MGRERIEFQKGDVDLPGGRLIKLPITCAYQCRTLWATIRESERGIRSDGVLRFKES